MRRTSLRIKLGQFVQQWKNRQKSASLTILLNCWIHKPWSCPSGVFLLGDTYLVHFPLCFRLIFFIFFYSSPTCGCLSFLTPHLSQLHAFSLGDLFLASGICLWFPSLRCPLVAHYTAPTPFQLNLSCKFLFLLMVPGTQNLEDSFSSEHSYVFHH
jgi:hypothetical protein